MSDLIQIKIQLISNKINKINFNPLFVASKTIAAWNKTYDLKWNETDNHNNH